MKTTKESLLSISEKENECSLTSDLICPHCLEKNSSDHFYEGYLKSDDNDDTIKKEIECSHCDKTFIASLDKYNQSHGYTTTPVPCKEDHHKYKLERVYISDDKKQYNVKRCSKCWDQEYRELGENGHELTDKQKQARYRSTQPENKPASNPKKGTIYISKDSISLQTEKAEGNREVFEQICSFLKSLGYKQKANDRLNNYETLKYFYRMGQWRELEFEAHYYPAGMSIEFFQNTYPGERGVGKGRYESNKRKYMPYILQKRLDFTLSKISSFLLNLKPHEFSLKVEKELDWHNRPNLDGLSREEACKKIIQYALPTPSESYNKKDKDGVLLRTGDTRYAYNYDGELIRGQCFPNINSMWYLVTSNNYYNLSSSDLFSLKPDTPSKKKLDKKKRLEVELSKAIENQNFERCIVLRDILKKS